MTDISFALIGCSSIAKKHAESLSRIEGVALSAVCDLDGAKAESLGKSYGVKPYTDYHQMFEREKIDVAVAAHALWRSCGARALTWSNIATYRGGKTDGVAPGGCRFCNPRLRRGRHKAIRVKQNRYNKPIQALRQALEAGRFGKLVLGTVRGALVSHSGLL
jgi:hypothetical protein